MQNYKKIGSNVPTTKIINISHDIVITKFVLKSHLTSCLAYVILIIILKFFRKEEYCAEKPT